MFAITYIYALKTQYCYTLARDMLYNTSRPRSRAVHCRYVAKYAFLT